MSTMNEYTKDLAIYNAIAEYAQIAFVNVVCKPGQYNAADILKNWQTPKNNNYIQFAEGFDANELVQINVEGFCAQMPVNMLFALLCRYEKQTGIKKADKAVFVRDDVYETVGVFVMPEDVKYVSKFVSKDDTLPSMCRVAVDMEKGYIVSTNGQALAVSRIDERTQGIKCPDVVLLDAKFAKACAGKEVTITSNYAKCCGMACELRDDLRFPNWYAVMPMVSDAKRIDMCGKFKELKKACALFGKYEWAYNRFTLKMNEGSGCLSVSSFGENECAGHQDIEIMQGFRFCLVLSNNSMKLIPNAECMYFGDNDNNPILFKNGNTLYLVLPHWDNRTYRPEIKNAFPSLDLIKHVPQCVETEMGTEQTIKCKEKPIYAIGDHVTHTQSGQNAIVVNVRQTYTPTFGNVIVYKLDFGKSVYGAFGYDLNGGEFMSGALSMATTSHPVPIVRATVRNPPKHTMPMAVTLLCRGLTHYYAFRRKKRRFAKWRKVVYNRDLYAHTNDLPQPP